MVWGSSRFAAPGNAPSPIANVWGCNPSSADIGSGVVPVRGVGGMDAAVKLTWPYLRRPLTGTAQTYRSD
jgi:hypothetical protein